MRKVSSPRAALARLTRPPSSTAPSTPTVAAAMRTVNSAARSWADTNMARAAASTPAAVPTTDASPTTTACVRSGARPGPTIARAT